MTRTVLGVTVAPVMPPDERKLLTLLVISPFVGSVFVPLRGVTAKRAPSRAAFVKICWVFMKRPASKIPKMNMKNARRMIAALTIVVPRSEWFCARSIGLFILFSAKKKGGLQFVPPDQGGNYVLSAVISAL